MLQLFRTNQLMFSMLMLLMILPLTVSDFIIPTLDNTSNWGPLAQYCLSFLHKQPIVAGITGIFLILLNGFYINYLLLEYRIESNATLFGGLFYCILAAALPGFANGSVWLVVQLCLMASISNIHASLHKKQAATLIFNSGFWIGIAALLYPAALLFGLGGLLGLLIIRALRLKELFIYLSGIFVPLFLAFTWIYLTDGPDSTFVPRFDLSFIKLGLQDKAHDWIPLLFFGLLLTIVLTSPTFTKRIKTKDAQKRVQVFFCYLLSSLFVVLALPSVSINDLQAMVLPLGVLLGLVVAQMSHAWASLFSIFLFISILFWQYKGWLLV